MSWEREIKTLITFSILLLSFIIWSFLINVFGGIDINHDLFLFTTLGCFIMQLLYTKLNTTHRKIISCIIPIIICITLYFVNYTFFIGVTYSIYTASMIVYMNCIEEKAIDYDNCKTMSVNALIVSFTVSILTMIVDKEFAFHLFRYYVFLLVVIIMLLRESRNFKFKIRSKYSKYFNLFISVVIPLACFSKTEIIFKKCLMFIIDKVLNVLLWLLHLPLTLLEKAVDVMRAHIDPAYADELLARMKTYIPHRDIFDQGLTPQYEGNYFISQVLKILFFIIIVFIIAKLLLKLISKFQFIKKDTEEIREQIKTATENKKSGKVKKFFKKTFKGNLSITMRILEVFKEFQTATKNKKIFKSSMTASQLKEVTKLQVDTLNELDEIALIYNEAKFSDHEMNEKQYRKIKENYIEIKKQL
ncbi:hypothetical protein [Oceanirhabdus seepicola]|uniref:DUF4129 domain-containing protein n=1 Tax=Oceanirhabdus seepicola TaxID=2828781 RepID=A0A9J6P358_9CLOT|nr:hypothetical protein [Oceanirhabdus seepicola]MCM1990812.1 hypothetical protein [Oceanirhabdus seepicola]